MVTQNKLVSVTSSYPTESHTAAKTPIIQYKCIGRVPLGGDDRSGPPPARIGSDSVLESAEKSFRIVSLRSVSERFVLFVIYFLFCFFFAAAAAAVRSAVLKRLPRGSVAGSIFGARPERRRRCYLD